jgi:small subunit ribosomal protein S17
MSAAESTPETLQPGAHIPHRKVFTGTIIRAKAKNTVVVEVRTTVAHAKYRKFIRRRQRFTAHDQQSTCRLGDRVEIVESRPLSRTKRWRVRKVLMRATAE